MGAQRERSHIHRSAAGYEHDLFRVIFSQFSDNINVFNQRLCGFVRAGRSGRPMERHNRETWVGPFESDEAVVERQKGLWGDGNAEMEYLRGNRWIVHQFGSTAEFIDVLPRRMMPIAEQLLGQPCVKPVVGAPTNCVNWGW